MPRAQRHTSTCTHAHSQRAHAFERRRARTHICSHYVLSDQTVFEQPTESTIGGRVRDQKEKRLRLLSQRIFSGLLLVQPESITNTVPAAVLFERLAHSLLVGAHRWTVISVLSFHLLATSPLGTLLARVEGSGDCDCNYNKA